MTPQDLLKQWRAEAKDFELQAKKLTSQGMYESAHIKRISARQLRECIQDLEALPA